MTYDKTNVKGYVNGELKKTRSRLLNSGKADFGIT